MLTNQGELNFNISQINPQETPLISNWNSRVSNSGAIAITLSSAQANGDYILASGGVGTAAEFSKIFLISLKNLDPERAYKIAPEKPPLICGGKKYSISCTTNMPPDCRRRRNFP